MPSGITAAIGPALQIPQHPILSRTTPPDLARPSSFNRCFRNFQEAFICLALAHLASLRSRHIRIVREASAIPNFRAFDLAALSESGDKKPDSWLEVM
jgi:hypothetical protein